MWPVDQHFIVGKILGSIILLILGSIVLGVLISTIISIAVWASVSSAVAHKGKIPIIWWLHKQFPVTIRSNIE